MGTYKETILINARSGLRKKKMFDALDDFDSVDDNVILPSSILVSKKDKKNKDEKEHKEEKKEKENNDDNDWLMSIGSFIPPDMSRSTKGKLDFNLSGGKKKKKKKKKKGSLHDYRSEFEPEMNLLKNIKSEQSKFVYNLQSKYNQLENSKTANRGVGKFTTDFISALTSARNLEMQAVREIVSLRKTIADLEFKERKEFGSKDSDSIDVNNQASLMLKQMVTMGRNNIVNGSVNDISNNSYEDYDEDDDLLIIDEDDDDNLKFESQNIEVIVEYDKDIVSEDALDKYNFVAYNSDGDIVPDYPLPTKTKMSVNESTEIAIDALGRKYKLKIV